MRPILQAGPFFRLKRQSTPLSHSATSLRIANRHGSSFHHNPTLNLKKKKHRCSRRSEHAAQRASNDNQPTISTQNPTLCIFGVPFFFWSITKMIPKYLGRSILEVQLSMGIQLGLAIHKGSTHTPDDILEAAMSRCSKS